MRIASTLIACLLLSGTLSPLSAQQDPPAEPWTELGRGTVEISVVGGTTLPVGWLRAHSDRHLTMASFDLGRVMTRKVGPGRVAGSAQMLISLTPLMMFSRPEHFTRGAAVSPLFLRWNFESLFGSRAHLFAEGSAGFAYTETPPAGDAFLNFLEQVGFGLRISRSQQQRWLVGYRFAHVSNGGRTSQNPGANYNFVYLGVTFLRRASKLSD